MTDYTQKAERDEMREFIGLINDGADHDRDVRLLLDACDTLQARAEAAEQRVGDLLAGRENDDRDFRRDFERIAALEKALREIAEADPSKLDPSGIMDEWSTVDAFDKCQVWARVALEAKP